MSLPTWGFAMRPDPVSSGAFAEALFAPDLPSPEGLTGREETRPQRRFSVYRNNVTVSLVDALASIFPTVQNLVGEDFFRAMARLYVAAHPPTSPCSSPTARAFPRFSSPSRQRRTYPSSQMSPASSASGSMHIMQRTQSRSIRQRLHKSRPRNW